MSEKSKKGRHKGLHSRVTLFFYLLLVLPLYGAFLVFTQVQAAPSSLQQPSAKDNTVMAQVCSTPTSVPTNPPMPTPTNPPMPTPTPIPTNTPIPTPTNTPTPIPTNTPIPTPTPDPTSSAMVGKSPTNLVNGYSMMADCDSSPTEVNSTATATAATATARATASATATVTATPVASGVGTGSSHPPASPNDDGGLFGPILIGIVVVLALGGLAVAVVVIGRRQVPQFGLARPGMRRTPSMAANMGGGASAANAFQGGDVNLYPQSYSPPMNSNLSYAGQSASATLPNNLPVLPLPEDALNPQMASLVTEYSPMLGDRVLPQNDQAARQTGQYSPVPVSDFSPLPIDYPEIWDNQQTQQAVTPLAPHPLVGEMREDTSLLSAIRQVQMGIFASPSLGDGDTSPSSPALSSDF